MHFLFSGGNGGGSGGRLAQQEQKKDVEGISSFAEQNHEIKIVNKSSNILTRNLVHNNSKKIQLPHGKKKDQDY